ncbi:MAG: M1 family aminopeptidase [Saprospiraceae bacterium]
MIKIQLLALTVCAVFFISCATTKNHNPGPETEDNTQADVDTMSNMDDTTEDIAYPYRPAEERKWDLLNTQLDLSFDWATSTVEGTATLTLSPLFYTQTDLKLDAVDFDIKKIMTGDKIIKDYTYDGNILTIPLAQPMGKRDRLTVTIQYSASPKPSNNDEGAAITSDQGLYFIDPLDTLPDVPRQIWSQGETSSNRKWFPTIDHPNERGTQEIILTVADTFMTLSNGTLISSTTLPNGMRRDDWKLELPIAPYLTMIAVGKWDKVTDYWRGRPVDYYVDPGYGKDARAIFAHTPEMIEFFSQKLGFDYVWPKYAQIIVKNFVSGAMENTTATVFGDFIQFHDEDVIKPGSNDYIVSHELFHHWFGDLVTCESWANITLNEGFANYAEYLWYEYKYGKERADVSRMDELNGYFGEEKKHPLIYYHYPDENAVFDAHSYNKGGLVLHMLRDLVGDEAFFASLRLYLQQHAYNSVEAADLRQAFEEVTGMDLAWFFDQWFYATGHPILDVHQTYDAETHRVTVDFTQTQDQQGYLEVFKLPVEVGVYYKNGSSDIHKIWLDQKSQTFTWDTKEPPATVIIDPRDVLLVMVNQVIDESENETRLLYTPSISHRVSAYSAMSEISESILEKLMVDSSETMRSISIQYFTDHTDTEHLEKMTLTEKDADLQDFLLQSLKDLAPDKAKVYALKLLETTEKTPVIYLALTAIAAVDIDEALRQATRYDQRSSPAIYAARAELFAQKGSGASLAFFKDDKAKILPVDYLEEFIASLAKYISGQSSTVQDEGLKLLNSEFYLQGPNRDYRRFYVILGLVKQYREEHDGALKNNLLILIKKHYSLETKSYLKDALKQGLGDMLD